MARELDISDGKLLWRSWLPNGAGLPVQHPCLAVRGIDTRLSLNFRYTAFNGQEQQVILLKI